MPHTMKAAVAETFGMTRIGKDISIPKADIEIQLLPKINEVFDQLQRGKVPSRVVTDFCN